MMKQRSCFRASEIYRITLVTCKADKTKVEDVGDESDEEREEKEVLHLDASHPWDQENPPRSIDADNSVSG